MTIKLNGEPYQTAASTVEALLKELSMPSVGIAVARNGTVVRKHELEETLLQADDEIEIIFAVQGG